MFILIAIGFLAGVATVLSPCILPILPIMLSGAVGGKNKPYGILTGFVLSFATFTVLATFIVRSLGIDLEILRYVAAAILIVMGALLLFPKVQYKFNSLIKLPSASSDKGDGFGGGFATGATLGLVWAPCAGPILAAVITLAATTKISAISFLIVLAYALGTGLVMLIIILASRRLLEKVKGLYTHLETIHKVFGVIIIITALGIGTGYDRNLQGYIVEHTPDSWNKFLQSFEESDAVQDALEDLEEKSDGDISNIQEISLKTNTREIMEEYINSGKFRKFKTNLENASIDINNILSGGPGKDGIPALTDPKFVSIDKAELTDDVLGVLIDIDGQKRYYPYNILVWHEVVNDKIGDQEIAVTFCPLCGSAIVFDRNVEDKVLEFGVSGFLYESNLLMYDKETESFWSQAGLEAVVGDYTGTKLKVLPMQLVPFDDIKIKYPDTKVLSRDTGHSRQYDFYPYGGYQESDELYFPVSVSDKQFKAKEVMFVVPYNGLSIAFPHLDLEDQKKAILDIEGKKFEAFRDDDRVTVTMDGEEIPFYYEMWFSWATQHQEDGVVWEVK
jgi:cytochrome c biogenesis protein CcdA